ncbi:glycosyltransferase [Nitrospira lenta]|uniref:Putative Glycosyl transferase group 1 n=1 Tax=Nitrospira lenta TaxID=1436998 RepID=A0A330LB69_9BACT|nr:glycosyltransferase [Nitrospira lenta]SPP66152.1 putative Glycosyl transferase group 1 [Nitrospira lenta]
MKILVLAPDIPATSKMPGSPRLFNLCRELSRQHELYLLTYCSSGERHQSFLNDPTAAKVFSAIEVLADPPAMTWWGQQWHRLHLAASFETRFRFPEYYRAICSKVHEMYVRNRCDLIYVDLLPMGQYVDQGLAVPAMIDLHDSMTLMARRVLTTTRGWRGRLSIYSHLMRIQQLEGALGRKFDLVVTNSSVDEQVIREVSSASNAMTITNGVDMGYFAPDHSRVDADKLVFTGVMGYGPNEDAAVFFAREIFPRVRKERPNAEFWIVGSEPTDRVKELGAIAGIYVTGQVEDVRPYLSQASVFVCPLRYGTGVKNKLLAAMAMQKPIVATSLSIDGLDLADNREVLLADEPQIFAEKVVGLLADQEAVSRIAGNGLARVQNQYSWAAMGQALEKSIQTIMESRKARGRQAI